MDTTRNLKVIITADSAQARAAMSSMAASTEALGSKVTSLGKSMTSVGKSMTTYMTLPIVGLGVATAKMAIDFQQQMTYVRTQAGDTEDSISKLSDQVLSLARSSQFGPDQLAQGLFHLASLGLRGADAMNALNTAQQLAAVGGANLEDTTSALGAALVTGIKGTQDFSEAAGTLNAIIGQGNMRMEDLVGALGSGVLPVAKNAGLTLQDVGAALATLTDNGMGAEESATRLRMTFALMEAPSTKAQKQLEAIGMSSNQMALDMRTKGLIPALADLKQHLLDTYGTTAEGQTKMARALTEIFGGGRSSAAAQTLIEQLDRVQTKYTAIADTTGQFANDVAQQQETASAKIKTAWSSIQVDAIQLGGSLLPIVAGGLDSIAKAADNLTKDWQSLTAGQQQFIIKTAEVLAVLGPGLTIFGKLVGTFGSLIKLTGGLTKMLGLGGLASAGAEAEGAIGSTGLLAALGPVGVGLGLVGIAAGGAYLWLKHFHKAAADGKPVLDQYGNVIQGTSGQISVLTLWQQAQAKATDDITKATDGLRTAQAAAVPQQQATQEATQKVADAQKNVNDALNKYGSNSPQYQRATLNLANAQDDYNQKLNNEIGTGLQVQILEGQLKKAKDDLANATYNANYWQNAFNNSVSTGITLTGSFANGINLQAIPALNNLQGSVAQVQRNVGGGIQIPVHVQVQGGGLNIQGSNVKLFASGTNYAPGGLAIVGENGPELVNLPRGSQVFNNKETREISHRTITIGTIVLASADAVKEMFNYLDQDNINVTKGLSPNRGMA